MDVMDSPKEEGYTTRVVSPGVRGHLLRICRWGPARLLGIAAGRCSANKARESGHPRTLSAVRERHGDALRITRILSGRGHPSHLLPTDCVIRYPTGGSLGASVPSRRLRRVSVSPSRAISSRS